MTDFHSVKLVLILILLTSIATSSSELLRPSQPPQINYAFNKFRPPPPPEPSFIQRITSWFFPWGGVSSEEEYRLPASPKIDAQPPRYQFHQQQQQQNQEASRISPVRDTEPTTARTTPRPLISKCSPCNKEPWIPMMPTHQQPLVRPSGQQQQVYFKHHFGNEQQYAQVPSGSGYNYAPPSSTLSPVAPPIKFQDVNVIESHQFDNAPPPINNVQFQSYRKPTQTPNYNRATSYRPNTNTIDTSVITFTTQRTQNNRPLRYTAAGSITNPEYILPPHRLPLEGENSNFAPIPIPNLSPSPIPPLFDAKPFYENPYSSQKTGFIKIVPLDPVAQLSNNVNIQVKPDENFREFEAVKESPNVEIVSSNLVAEFTIPSGDLVTRSPVQENLRINLDVENFIESNDTKQKAGKGNSTDNAFAASEHSFSEDINQRLEAQFSSSRKSEEAISLEINEANRFTLPQDFSQVLESDEATTTEGNYVVEFEPSLQTAADLAEKSTIKPKSETLPNNRNRQTPLQLLDSPAKHATAFTTKPTETIPPFKPIEDFTKKLATLWTSSPPILTSTEASQTPPVFSATQSSLSSSLHIASTTNPSFLSDITPPREPPKPAPSTKKPKQIQIVIPYTTFNKPSPFKIQSEQEAITYRTIRGHYLTRPTASTVTTKWSEKVSSPSEENFSNDQEYLDHAQESKIVESKVTVEPQATTKYLTKILANNIRDLLKKEKSPKPTKIDLMKLQKNIDGWTEQSFKGKASTISLMGHTKAIPKAFLSTTTMKATTMMKLPTTTLSPKTTFDPDLMEETKRQYDNILYKKEEESLYVKRHDRYLNRDNELVLLNNNLTYDSLHDGIKVFAPKTTLSPKELWKRLHLTISPLTNEKIYVVTPQPPLAEDRRDENLKTFKPRFAIRPTVAGIKVSSERLAGKLIGFVIAGKKHSKKLTPEMSRMGDGMELMNVETIDGHSKV